MTIAETFSSDDYLRRKTLPVPEGFVPREFCYRCLRAQTVCICDQIDVVCNRTGVIVIQHHRERMHPIGTARIARLGLQKSNVVVAERHRQLAVDFKLPSNTGLLYPNHRARSIETLDPAEFPEHLIVLDGTWCQAKSLYKANAFLQDVPHLVINPASPSRYRIRRQPRAGYLSTIESLVHALSLIEPHTPGLDGLITTFDRLVQLQIDHRDSVP
jgi:DTW domain-containing protein